MTSFMSRFLMAVVAIAITIFSFSNPVVAQSMTCPQVSTCKAGDFSCRLEVCQTVNEGQDMSLLDLESRASKLEEQGKALEAAHKELARVKDMKSATRRIAALERFRRKLPKGLVGKKEIEKMISSAQFAPAKETAKRLKTLEDGLGTLRAAVKDRLDTIQDKIDDLQEKVDDLQGKVNDHEGRIVKLEKSPRPIQFQLGILGGVYAFGRDVAGAGLLDMSLWFNFKDNWGVVLLGQIGAGNRPNTHEAAFPWNVGLAFGPEYRWGRFLFGAKSVGFRGLGNESRAEGFGLLLRTDVHLAKVGKADLRLTLEVADGPAWRRGSLSNVFQASAGFGFQF